MFTQFKACNCIQVSRLNLRVLHIKMTKRPLFLIQICCIITTNLKGYRFIAPDRTKFEREKHVKLINELRERKAKGETNMIIRNGC